MIQQIRQLLGLASVSGADTPTPEDARFSTAAREAAVALLYRMVMADFSSTEPEETELRRAVERLLDAPGEELEPLLQRAERSAKESVSLYDFTSVLHRELPADAKREIVELLWLVAFADGELDPQEEFLVRKVAKLLYVDHADFIAAKQRARAAHSARR